VSSFFKPGSSGKFAIKDSLAYKNLRLVAQDHLAHSGSDEYQRQLREEH
jgi:hypothetical protein